MAGNSEAFADWLKDQGKWDEFKAMRQSMEEHGRTKKGAYEEAARAYGMDKFLQLQGEASPMKHKAPEMPSKDVFKGKTSTLRGDFQWVYENLSVDDVSPEDAPSSGAWGLLRFARSDTKTFYQEWMRLVAKAEDTSALEREVTEDARRTTAEIAAKLKSIRAAVVPPGSEDPGGEPAVPAGDPGESSGGQGLPAADD